MGCDQSNIKMEKETEKLKKVERSVKEGIDYFPLLFFGEKYIILL